MLDPICNREITAEMLERDALRLFVLMHRLLWTPYAGCIPALGARLDELQRMRQEIGRLER